MTASRKEDLFGANCFFGAVVEDDFYFISVKKVGTAVDVFDFVFLEVSLVDVI